MNTASNFTATRTAVAVIRAGQPKSASVRIRQTVRRLMNALMQSLATPHI